MRPEGTTKKDRRKGYVPKERTCEGLRRHRPRRPAEERVNTEDIERLIVGPR